SGRMDRRLYRAAGAGPYAAPEPELLRSSRTPAHSTRTRKRILLLLEAGHVKIMKESRIAKIGGKSVLWPFGLPLRIASIFRRETGIRSAGDGAAPPACSRASSTLDEDARRFA